MVDDTARAVTDGLKSNELRTLTARVHFTGSAVSGIYLRGADGTAAGPIRTDVRCECRIGHVRAMRLRDGAPDKAGEG